MPPMYVWLYLCILCIQRVRFPLSNPLAHLMFDVFTIYCVHCMPHLQQASDSNHQSFKDRDKTHPQNLPDAPTSFSRRQQLTHFLHYRYIAAAVIDLPSRQRGEHIRRRRQTVGSSTPPPDLQEFRGRGFAQQKTWSYCIDMVLLFTIHITNHDGTILFYFLFFLFFLFPFLLLLGSYYLGYIIFLVVKLEFFLFLYF